MDLLKAVKTASEKKGLTINTKKSAAPILCVRLLPSLSDETKHKASKFEVSKISKKVLPARDIAGAILSAHLHFESV